MIDRRVGAAALVGLLSACNPQAQHAAASPTPAPSARGSLPLRVSGHGAAGHPIHVFERKGNRTQAELVANSFVSVGPQGSQRAVFQNARVTFHDAGGSTLRAVAPQAIVDQRENTIVLVGGVNARTASGMTLHCDRLLYSRDDEMLHGSGNVLIVDPQGFRGTGSRFESNIALTKYRME